MNGWTSNITRNENEKTLAACCRISGSMARIEKQTIIAGIVIREISNTARSILTHEDAASTRKKLH